MRKTRKVACTLILTMLVLLPSVPSGAEPVTTFRDAVYLQKKTDHELYLLYLRTESELQTAASSRADRLFSLAEAAY